MPMNLEFALLDTNILSALLDGSKKSERFVKVFDFLEEKRLHPYIIKRITEFEFVGYSTDKRKYDELSSWMENFDGLPPNIEDFDVARLLSAMYKCKNPSINPRQISFVDLLYAAHLIRVKGRACIVTTDLNDYPSFLFDMPVHFAIEEPGGSTSFVGIKTFSQEKYDNLVKSFEKSGT